MGLVIPVWFCLDIVPLEYLDMTRDMAGYVGEIFEIEYREGMDEDHRFIVVIDPEKEWVSTLFISCSLEQYTKVLVMYDNKEVKCEECLDITHLERDFPQRLHKADRCGKF